MTCLPRIARELRARARNRAIYRLRLAAGAAGVIICVPELFNPFATASPTLGHSVFNALAIAAFILCCSACLWAADVISSEKREGTLGLLFLTHVREFDLLTGKFGSAGLTGLCSLAAFLPMLMFPVLAGGVTGGEAARTALVLLNTLFLALATGMCQSAANRSRSDAVGRALMVVAGLVLLPYLAMKLPGIAQSGLGYLSPLCGLGWAEESAYKKGWPNYWIGLGTTQVMGWMMATGAAYHLRRSVRQTVDGGAAALVEETAARPTGRRVELPLAAGMNPVEWLVLRQRGIKPLLWAGAAVVISYHLFWLVFERRRFGPPSVFGPFFSMQLLWLAWAGPYCACIAWGASRFFMNARASGELELLATTGLDRLALVTGQWQALKRLAAVPAGAMVLMSWMDLLFPAGLRGTVSVAQWGPGGFFYSNPFAWAAQHFLPAVLGSVHTLLALACIAWLALDSALRAPNLSRVILRCLWWGTLLPYLIYTAATGYGHLAVASLWYHLPLGTPANRSLATGVLPYIAGQVAAMAYLGWQLWRARRRLLTALPRPEAGAFTLQARGL